MTAGGAQALAGALAGTALAVIGSTVAHRSAWGRRAGALSALGALLTRVLVGGLVPLQALALGVAWVAWFGPSSEPASRRFRTLRGATFDVTAAWGALGALVLAWVLDDAESTGSGGALLRVLVAAMPVLIPGARPLPGSRIAGLLPLGLGALAIALGEPAVAHPGLLALGPLALIASARWTAAPPDAHLPLPTHPSTLLVSSFALICAVGTATLTLPGMATVELPLIDAAFTAVSATCVTGLIVVDTPIAFTFAGQAVILGLIQVGGLGIMTFSAALLAWVGQRISVAHEASAATLVGAEGRSAIGETARRILAVTAVTELLAAAALTARFAWRGEPPTEAAWRGLFTSVSAFCNAGFALQSDSLVPYADDPWVLGTVGVAIVVGGLGPSVVVAVPSWVRGRRVSLHVRLVLTTTLALLAASAALFVVLEWNQSLADLSAPNRIANAMFQGITLRTAGFNSVDLAGVRPATWTALLAFMWIGGSPGSTAGGIKTTTFAVLALGVLAAARGHREIVFAGRTVSHRTVVEAGSLLTLAVVCTMVALMALQLTQVMPLDVALFEVVSALATVGLSIGGTGALDDVGKVILIVCMFAGRVGPLSLFALLAVTRSPERARYPEDRVPVG